MRQTVGGWSASRTVSAWRTYGLASRLSDRDRSIVFDQRGPGNRLGLAVSLCALRFLGFVPEEIASIPDEALAFLAG